MTPEEFKKLVFEKADKEGEVYGIFPPPINAQEGLNILIKHFLGDSWYCISTNNEQGNTEAIYEILCRYRKKTLLQRIKSIKNILKK